MSRKGLLGFICLDLRFGQAVAILMLDLQCIHTCPTASANTSPMRENLPRLYQAGS